MSSTTKFIADFTLSWVDKNMLKILGTNSISFLRTIWFCGAKNWRNGVPCSAGFSSCSVGCSLSFPQRKKAISTLCLKYFISLKWTLMMQNCLQKSAINLIAQDMFKSVRGRFTFLFFVMFGSVGIFWATRSVNHCGLFHGVVWDVVRHLTKGWTISAMFVK